MTLQKLINSANFFILSFIVKRINWLKATEFMANKWMQSSAKRQKNCRWRDKNKNEKPNNPRKKQKTLVIFTDEVCVDDQ